MGGGSICIIQRLPKVLPGTTKRVSFASLFKNRPPLEYSMWESEVYRKEFFIPGKRERRKRVSRKQNIEFPTGEFSDYRNSRENYVGKPCVCRTLWRKTPQKSSSSSSAIMLTLRNVTLEFSPYPEHWGLRWSRLWTTPEKLSNVSTLIVIWNEKRDG